MTNTIGQVTVKGIVYNIEEHKTLEEMKVDLPNLAAHMEDSGQVASLVLQRPRGRKLHMATEWNTGQITICLSV